MIFFWYLSKQDKFIYMPQINVKNISIYIKNICNRKKYLMSFNQSVPVH